MEADLYVTAKKLVLLGFQKNADLLSKISTLEGQLNDVFSSHQPNKHEYDQRRDLIRIFNEIARELYGRDNECPIVEEFGSFLMDIFNAKSDLDLSINFSDKKEEAGRDVKIKALRKFATKFYALQKKKHVTNVQPILSARVPILKVTDCGTGIECDLSVGNMDGIVKSHIILLISSIDERFKKLCFLMKAWAKAHNINSSKDGTLNSLSLILLVAFHLQSREPPVLPPFSAIFKDGTNPEAVKENIPNFLNYGNGNKESLADLFVSLLVMLESAETLWPMGLCVSTYKGSWIYKTWETKKGNKIGLISIEDFTIKSQNTARAVKSNNIIKIYSCIRHSLQQIRSYTKGKINAEKLTNRLFGPDSLTEMKGINIVAQSAPQQPNSEDPTQGKRKRGKQKKEKRRLKKVDECSHIGTKKKQSNKVDGSSHIGSRPQVPLHSNPSIQSPVGFSYERSGSSHMGTRPQVPLHSNLPPIQSPEGFRYERNVSSHIGTWPQFPLHSNPVIQSPVGFRYERSHAEIWRYPTPNPYLPLASTSGSAMPYHHTPYLPPVPYTPYPGFETYASSQPPPLASFHVPNNWNFSVPAEINTRHNPSGANDPYPSLFYGAP